MIKLTENMIFPPNGPLDWKMQEHSAWYSGDPNLLVSYYTMVAGTNPLGLPFQAKQDTFWGRNIRNQVEIGLHVPIAGDIAETSADLLFAEAPSIRIAEANAKSAPPEALKTQDALVGMLSSGYYQKFTEAAEVCAAIGGAYIKIAWDRELSPYPIPVVEQADQAIPEFKFGILTSVAFWSVVHTDTNGSKIYRLVEYYEADGSIRYELYLGTSDRLGNKVSLTSFSGTAGLKDITTGLGSCLAVYVPNMYPNRYNRNSYVGRSDYSGIEGMMDALDDTYSSWMKDVILARGRIHLPESYLEGKGASFRFNVDKSAYVALDMDPMTDQTITATQFLIRADEFEKTTLNLLERIITSAGYSPQSFGLNIQGRAESGTALNIRERKSFSTKNKKENYWKPAIQKLMKYSLAIYQSQLGGKVDPNLTIVTQFSDSISNDISETSTALQKISAAYAASTETKVKLLHPDWTEPQVIAEVDKIIFENGLGTMANPDDLGDFGGEK